MKKTKTNNQVSQFYLAQTNHSILSREEEGKLMAEIELIQKQILKQIVQDPFARSELRAYLEYLVSHEESVVDISKNLTDESSEKELEEVKVALKDLVTSLFLNDIEAIEQSLEVVALTGTILHGIVLEIEKKFQSVVKAKQKQATIFKFFIRPTDQSIILIFQEILRQPEVLKTRIMTDFSLSEIKAENAVHELNRLVHEIKVIQKLLPDDITYDDVENLYKSISILERTASKFKTELITKNLRLVFARANKFKDRGLDFEDLIQEGNIGLMRAINKFDASRKTKISTYATWWIDQSIRRAISNKGKTVRVPTHIEWQQTNINSLIQKMTGQLKREPTLLEISKESGVELETLEDLRNRANHEVSLEAECQSGKSVLETLPDTNYEQNPFNVVERNLLRKRIREMLSTLKPRDEMIIRLRFGIGEVPDEEGVTLQEIADKLGNITKQGVRVAECNALRKLRAHLGSTDV